MTLTFSRCLSQVCLPGAAVGKVGALLEFEVSGVWTTLKPLSLCSEPVLSWFLVAPSALPIFRVLTLASPTPGSLLRFLPPP